MADLKAIIKQGEGMDRISIRDAILREVASNILIHREYRNAFPAKLIIERGLVRTENSNKPHGLGALDPATFTPFPKNPVIGAFFREIHRADEIGSGMRKLMKYGKAYGGDDPQMVEGDVFRIVVKVPEFGAVSPATTDLETAQAATDGASAVTGQVAGEVTGEVTGEVIQLLKLLSDKALSRKVLQERLGLKGEANFRQRYLAPALSDDLIEMTQPGSPKSPTQQYRLTDAGKHLLKSMQG
jgi:ATP-dependent DNA helicase RecG